MGFDLKNTYTYSIIDPINKLIIKFIPNQTLTFNSNSLNINNIINNKYLIPNQIINNVDSSDGSYTPSDSNQLDELNNNEIIINNESN